MQKKNLLSLFEDIANGNISPEEATEKLKMQPVLDFFEGLSLDLHRSIRTGIGEVVFGAGKENKQLIAAIQGLQKDEQPVLVTKLRKAQCNFLQRRFPDGKAWPQAGLFTVNTQIDLSPPWPQYGDVLIVAAGTSDLPIALEALGAAMFLGLSAGLITDVGVAGLHRITPHLANIAQSKALIVIAGMEGALPSVLAGLVDKPVIAVPTSVGYGANLAGLTPLMAMLNSCAPGIAVVNIDNGFGAACFIFKMLQTIQS